MLFPEAVTLSVCPGLMSAEPSWWRWSRTLEIIRSYYAPSTRLAQALFWGEYNETFSAGRSGVFEEGVVRVHLRRWLEDQDAWTLARYMCSPVMQREASKLYKSLQLYQLNTTTLISEPDQALPWGFPFEGPTAVLGHICPFARAYNGELRSQFRFFSAAQYLFH